MARTIVYLIVISVSLSSCYSLKKSIEAGKPYNETINWPKGYNLSETEFYIHNKIDIDAPPETVWNVLIRAEDWPGWYKGMEYTEIIGSEDGVLSLDSKMKFKTMNRDFEATIIEYELFKRLTWESINPKLNALHAWLIIPTARGCLVITDESQYGKLAKLQTIFVPNKLRKLHDVWLTELKIKAEAKNN